MEAMIQPFQRETGLPIGNIEVVVKVKYGAGAAEITVFCRERVQVVEDKNRDVVISFRPDNE